MTGHAETVEVEYNPSEVSYQQLLDAFWKLHDPTQANMYRGGQYRSAIFVYTASQKKIAQESKASLQKRLGKMVMTEITQAPTFYPAEDYHQDYYLKNHVGTCSR